MALRKKEVEEKGISEKVFCEFNTLPIDQKDLSSLANITDLCLFNKDYNLQFEKFKNLKSRAQFDNIKVKADSSIWSEDSLGMIYIMIH